MSPANAVKSPEKGSITIKMRGLPWEATISDIFTFFRGHDLQYCKLQLGHDGRPSGLAMAVFGSKESAAKAMKECNNKFMGRRYIELFECPIDIPPPHGVSWKQGVHEDASGRKFRHPIQHHEHPKTAVPQYMTMPMPGPMNSPMYPFGGDPRFGVGGMVTDMTMMGEMPVYNMFPFPWMMPMPVAHPSPVVEGDGLGICKFWLEGRCRYGSSCRMLHIREIAPAGIGEQ